MPKRFESLPKYAQEHRASPKRKGTSDVQLQVASCIQGLLNADAEHQVQAALLNNAVRMWHRGRGEDDCDFQSEGVLSAKPSTVVEVEHGVEVSELVRHLIGNADQLHRNTYRSERELAENPSPTWEEVIEAVSSRNQERINDINDRWGGIEWSGPPPNYKVDLDQLVAFMNTHYVRILVTEDEHDRLGKANSGRTNSHLWMLEPAGAHLARYRNAGVRVVAMGSEPATPQDLWLPH